MATNNKTTPAMTTAPSPPVTAAPPPVTAAPPPPPPPAMSFPPPPPPGPAVKKLKVSKVALLESSASKCGYFILFDYPDALERKRDISQFKCSWKHSIRAITNHILTVCTSTPLHLNSDRSRDE